MADAKNSIGLTFLDERSRFENELDAYFGAPPLDIAPWEQELHAQSRQHPEWSPSTACATCWRPTSRARKSFGICWRSVCLNSGRRTMPSRRSPPVSSRTWRRPLRANQTAAAAAKCFRVFAEIDDPAGLTGFPGGKNEQMTFQRFPDRGQQDGLVAGFHSLRHSAVSFLRQAGAAPNVLPVVSLKFQNKKILANFSLESLRKKIGKASYYGGNKLMDLSRLGHRYMLNAGMFTKRVILLA